MADYVQITVYDVSEAPIHPDALERFERIIEDFAKRERLVINVAEGTRKAPTS